MEKKSYWLIMTDEKDEKNTRDYHLAPKQRKRINNKEALADAATSPGEQLKNIQKNKVEKLPERINRLFIDIELLARADFFTTDWEHEIWDRVDLNNDTWEDWDWEPYFQDLFYDKNYRYRGLRNLSGISLESHQFNGPVDFGIELGVMLNILSDSHISTDEQCDLLLGIFVGLIQPGVDEQGSKYDNEYDAILEQCNIFRQKFDELEHKIMKNRGNKYSVENMYQDHDKIVRDSITEIDDLARTNPLEYYLIENFDYPDNGQTKEERKQKKSDMKDCLRDLIENTDINQIETLRKYIDDSINCLDDSVNGGEELLSEVYQYGIFDYSDIEYSGNNKEQIVNILSGDHEFSDLDMYQKLTQNPVIQRVSRDSHKTEWTTTEFGTLVGYLIDTGKSPGWVHNYIIERENLTTEDKQRIEQALSELDL